jgi:hypothetical protein
MAVECALSLSSVRFEWNSAGSHFITLGLELSDTRVHEP